MSGRCRFRLDLQDIKTFRALKEAFEPDGVSVRTVVALRTGEKFFIRFFMKLNGEKWQCCDFEIENPHLRFTQWIGSMLNLGQEITVGAVNSAITAMKKAIEESRPGIIKED